MKRPKKDYVPEDGWLFYFNIPVAVIVKGTYAEARAARDTIKRRWIEEQYVHWFDDVKGVDRALLTEDQPTQVKGGHIEEY